MQDIKQGKPFFIIIIFILAAIMFSLIVLQIVRSNNATVDTQDQTEALYRDEEFLQEKDKCVITGCSGQVCAKSEAITSCEYREVYNCYRTAACELQANGDCGWTQTSELKECIKNNAS